MPLKVIELRPLLQILTMFMIVQFLGLLFATQLFTGAVFTQVSGAQLSTFVNAVYYIVYILVVSALLLLLMRVFKGSTVFRILEGVVIFFSSFIAFLAVLSMLTGVSLVSLLFGNGSLPVLVTALILSLSLVVAKNRFPRLRNATAVLSSAGVGFALGAFFSFQIALVFMVLLAVYDFVAVFITKHMVTMANMAIENNLAFLIMANEVKAVSANSLSKNELAEYNKEKPMIRKKGGIGSELIRRNMVPMAASSALGTGDLATPLMLAVSAYGFSLSFVLSFFMIAGGALGLLLNMVVLRKLKRVLPAIPLLLAGELIMLALYYGLRLL